MEYLGNRVVASKQRFSPGKLPMAHFGHKLCTHVCTRVQKYPLFVEVGWEKVTHVEEFWQEHIPRFERKEDLFIHAQMSLDMNAC